ncbi:SEC-C metal-binding domain-containing protein [Cytophagaceae bacterium DM2B3-1]|uniref:SEC-C metal-binding domain-containing protein n=1 Tax=Xanthocytophaga flava TaxID=3048013 RepID=A0ABT7CYG1_9BACT|nr:SEC-C metal-binding domain-containing protein [Xanthocytophaga flavus]MDJ1498797.1 SEC-C metal-binding domain-containing protein [Xanthocytophaga flavus]
MINQKSILRKDLDLVKELFPKLTFKSSKKYKAWYLIGDLDICDAKGVYWNTFNIKIVIPQTYPYCVPVVIEKSSLIPREDDRHISEQGVCCLDVDHKLLVMAKRGIRLLDFIKQKVYPYFANQLYFEAEGHYAAGEFSHGFAGIKDFYLKDLKLSEIETIISFIEMVLNNTIPGRNDLCPCNSGEKLKNCHLDAVDLLRSIRREQLTQDLQCFNSLE